ncbi:MAG: hypothetical protein AAGC81_16025 [Pseudomonadota bacterium]
MTANLRAGENVVPLWAAVALVVAARLLVADAQINWDEELYFQIARYWSAETLPYRDLFDHKPPMLFLWAKLVSGWGESMALIRVVQTLLLFGALLLLLRQFAGRLPLLWVVVILALLSLPASLGTNAEIIYLPMILAGLAWALAGNWAIAGIAAALAVSVKYTVALDLIGVFLVYMALAGQRSAKQLLVAAVIGFAAIQLALYLYFWMHGIDLIEETIIRNLTHAEGSRSVYIPKTALLGFSVLGAVIGSRLVVHGRYGERWLVAALLAWTLLSFLQSQVTGRSYAHYFVPVFVPLSILAFLDWPARTVGFFRVCIVALTAALSIGVLTLSVLSFRGDQLARQELAGNCPDGPFQYHGGYLAAYRACDAAQPGKYFYPPFYSDLHFIGVSGSGGDRWACALERPILIETQTGYTSFENGQDWCRSTMPKQAQAFSGIRKAVRDLIGNGK